MKKLVLLILLVIQNYLGYSQNERFQDSTLTPSEVYLLSYDTLFCWDIKKSKQLAKIIISEENCNEIQIINDSLIGEKNKMIQNLNKERSLLEIDIKSLERIIDEKDTIISNQIDINRLQDKEIKLLKKRNLLSIGGSVILFILLIIK